MPKGDNVAELPSSAPRTVKAVVVPLDTWETILDAVKSAPYRDANTALKVMNTCQIHDVTMTEKPQSDD